MLVIVTGGTGFIGQALVPALLAAGHEVAIVSRSASRAARIFGRGVVAATWESDILMGLMQGAPAVVNLAGDNIAKGRWTEEKKERILQSRLQAGKDLIRCAERAGTAPSVVIQGSAVGYYGPCSATPVDEAAPQGSGFLADVAGQWEESTKPLKRKGTRLCQIRTGMVLGKGGALSKMLPSFKMGFGGPLGEGTQGVSWIHLEDEVRAIIHLLEHEEAMGPFNLTAPGAVTNRRMARELGKVLGRPTMLRMPAFILRALIGPMADEVLLQGQIALPARLAELGFTFKYPDLPGALAAILKPGQ